MREQNQSSAGRTRRDFLKAGVSSPNRHIASVVVQAWPDRIPELEPRLTRLRGVESHGSGGTGKLILTIETESDGELVDAMNRIGATDGVITVSLVYHHVEEMDDE